MAVKRIFSFAMAVKHDVSERVCVRVTRVSMPTALKIVCETVRDGVWCPVGQTSAHIKCKQEGDKRT